MRRGFVIFILICSALSLSADEDGFARYQIIIDKRPFGEEPPETETVQISLNESFAKNLRLSMLYEGPGGDLRAGIIDASRNKSYILKVGEIEDSIELVEADINASEAMLRKGNEVALFKLKTDDKPTLLSKKQQSTRQNSYAERRRALLNKVAAQKKKEAPKVPKFTGEALRKHLEEVQMDAIRKGLPPLPMELTPEMDAQLVSEGVLDPQ